MTQSMKKKIEKALTSKREEGKITVPLIDNSREVEIKDKNKKVIATKKITQFRVSIPKVFSDAIEINKEDFEMEFTLSNDKTLKKPQYILTAKLKKKK